MNRILQTSLIVIISCFQTNAQTDCDCWETEFIGQELDYSLSFKEMESSYIEQGYLEDEQPSSYFRLLDSIISKNEYFPFDIDFNPILVSKIEKCFMSNSCDK